MLKSDPLARLFLNIVNVASDRSNPREKFLFFFINWFSYLILRTDAKRLSVKKERLFIRVGIKRADKYLKFVITGLLPSWHSDVVSCHNVVVDVATTFWHGRVKWKLCKLQFPTLWQRRCPTLSRRSHDVATTSPQQ